MCPIYFVLLVSSVLGRIWANSSLDERIGIDSMVVKTTSGHVEGFITETPLGKSVDTYLGIPYGAPTGGENRFSPPKEPTPWEGTFQAKSLPNSCIQGVIPNFTYADDRIWESGFPELDSEDCLKLNIWIPKPRRSNFPVLVWINGGALHTGGTNKELYNGAILASEEEIIVLTFNYRISVFGFLFLDHPDTPGNVGLMDQAAALRWIQKNIANFGGDPKMVTFSGHSGGGFSVGYHLLIPSSSGLFKRATMQSGNPYLGFFSRSKMEALYFSLLFAKHAGCDSTNALNQTDTDGIIQCLKSKDVSVILSAAGKMVFMHLPFIPVIDGSFLPSHPRVLLKQKTYSHKSELLLGTTMEDGLICVPLLIPETVFTNNTVITDKEIQFLTKFIVTLECDTLADAIKYHYVDWEDSQDPFKNRKLVIQLLNDVYLCGDNAFSNDFSANGNPVFKYIFNHKPSTSRFPKWTGSMIGDEIPFIFGVPLNPAKGFNHEEKLFARNVMHYWANFVKYGNPNSGPQDLFNWPRYTVQGKPTLKLGLEPSILNNYRVQECAFWEHVFPGLKALYKNTLTL